MSRIVMMLMLLSGGLCAQDAPSTDIAHPFEVSVEVRYVTIPADTWNQLGLKPTTIVPPQHVEDEIELSRAEADPGQQAIQLVSATSMTEYRPPISYQMMTAEHMKILTEAVQANPKSKVQFAPKVTIPTGKTASIRSTTKRPFVVDVQDQKPKVLEFEEGTIISVRPDLQEDNSLDLSLRIELRQIKDVKTQPKEGDMQVQVPEMASTRIELGAHFSDHQSLALWGGNLTTQVESTMTKRSLFGRHTAVARENVPMMLLITPRVIESAAE